MELFTLRHSTSWGQFIASRPVLEYFTLRVYRLELIGGLPSRKSFESPSVKILEYTPENCEARPLKVVLVTIHFPKCVDGEIYHQVVEQSMRLGRADWRGTSHNTPGRVPEPRKSGGHCLHRQVLPVHHIYRLQTSNQMCLHPVLQLFERRYTSPTWITHRDSDSDASAESTTAVTREKKGAMTRIPCIGARTLRRSPTIVRMWITIEGTAAPSLTA